MLTARPDPATLRASLRSRVEQALGPDLEAAFLYGSRARGDWTEDSDWDVLVVVREGADVGAISDALLGLTRRLYEEAGEDVRFLALRWSDADNYVGLLRNVAREGERL